MHSPSDFLPNLKRRDVRRLKSVKEFARGCDCRAVSLILLRGLKVLLHVRCNCDFMRSVENLRRQCLDWVHRGMSTPVLNRLDRVAVVDHPSDF